MFEPRMARQLELELGQFDIKGNEFQETSFSDILTVDYCVDKFNLIPPKPPLVCCTDLPQSKEG